MTTTKDPLKNFRADAPPDFSKLPDPFGGRSGPDLTLADRVRIRVLGVMNPDKAPKLEKRMGKLKLAVNTPRLKYKPADERSEEQVMPETIAIGDNEYSRNLLLTRFGFGDMLKKKEDERKRKADSTARELLGELKAERKYNLEDTRETTNDTISPAAAKTGAEGASLDTAAQKAKLFAIKNIRDAVNSGKKLPAESRAEVDASIKKEAMRTFFLAGFISAAGADTVGLVDTPMKLAAFFHGFLRKDAAPGSSHGTGALPSYRGAAQPVMPAQRVPAGPKPDMPMAQTPPPLPVVAKPAAPVPQTVADFIGLLRKQPRPETARLGGQPVPRMDQLDPVDAKLNARRQLIAAMKQQHAEQFRQPQLLNA